MKLHVCLVLLLEWEHTQQSALLQHFWKPCLRLGTWNRQTDTHCGVYRVAPATKKSQHGCLRGALREHPTPPCYDFTCGGLKNSGLWFRMSNFRMSNDLFRQREKFFDRTFISRNLFEGNLSQRIMSKQNSLKQNYDKENSLK